MDIAVTHDADIAMLQLTGSLLTDAEGTQLMEAVLQELEAGQKRFVLDLSELKHVNSSGLGIFIRLLTRIRTAGGELVVCGISPGLSNLFTITKLHTIFRIADSRDAARQLFSA